MDQIAPNAPHWWGFAAMPENMNYPFNGEDNPLTLICQFHLGDGMVYVLADLDYFFGYPEVEGGHIGEWDKHLYRVLYSPTREDLHEHEIRLESGEPAVPDPEPLDGPAKRQEASGILQQAQNFRDEVTQDYPDYQVLVELDENDEIGLRFYDCGTLYFLIRPEDLEARRFDDVKCVLYSY